jgi:hypothetical protein
MLLLNGIIKKNNTTMKNSQFALGTMLAAFFLFSCEENLDPSKSNKLEQLTLDRIEKNEGISYNLFSTLTEGFDAQALNDLKAASGTKAEFIAAIADQTKKYFPEVVEMSIGDFQIIEIPMPYSGEAEITLKALESRDELDSPPYLDFPGDYSNVILKEIETQTEDGHKDWIIIESYADGTAEAKPLPQETISLNYEKIKMLATVPHTVFMNMSLTDEQVLVTINEMLISHDIPPVAIGLLLPAVQKIRESASTDTEPFGTALKTWHDGTVGEAINGGLNRDIIRRVQATAFLAGLHTIVLKEYDNTNQDVASLSILHARFRAAVIGTASGGIWK